MALLLAFAAVLIVSVLLSERIDRSILSTSVMFLAAGFAFSPGALSWVSAPHQAVLPIAEIALFTSLFVDGMHAPLSVIKAGWRLPGRALAFGMPLTFVGNSVLAYALAGLSWKEAFLVGAVLTPTDPVFAAALIGRKGVPLRLRNLLNVESGLNDGLALPVVLILLSSISTTHTSTVKVLIELAGGVAIGIVVPYVVLHLERLSVLGVGGKYEQLTGLALALFIYAVCKVTGANAFLAAFAGGSTLATISPASRASFEELGDALSEITKLMAIFVFGVLMQPELFGRISIGEWVCILLLLVLVRPVSLVVALVGERLDKKEWASAAWFGPKGFASVTYGLLVFESSAVHANRMFDFVAACVTVSIVAHSTTDTVVARAFGTT